MLTTPAGVQAQRTWHAERPQSRLLSLAVLHGMNRLALCSAQKSPSTEWVPRFLTHRHRQRSYSHPCSSHLQRKARGTQAPAAESHP